MNISTASLPSNCNVITPYMFAVINIPYQLHFYLQSAMLQLRICWQQNEAVLGQFIITMFIFLMQ